MCKFRESILIELHKHTARDATVREWVRENRVGREFKKYLGKSKAG